MATSTNNMSRRETLVGIAICGSTAAIPVANATPANAMQQPDRKAWNAAFARYTSLKKQADVLGVQNDRLADHYHAETERLPHTTIGEDKPPARRLTSASATQS